MKGADTSLLSIIPSRSATARTVTARVLSGRAVGQTVDVPRYYLGVIDMLQVKYFCHLNVCVLSARNTLTHLQDWNMSKRMEQLEKDKMDRDLVIQLLLRKVDRR